MKYKELKEYFTKNSESLPETLGNDFIFIPDVKKTVDGLVFLVDTQVRQLGDKANKSRYAKTGVNNLRAIHKLLQDPENHNRKGLPERAFSNFRIK